MITDQALAQAALEYDEAMLCNISHAHIPDHEFSVSFEKNFKKLSCKSNRLMTSKLLTTVAILTIVCICVASLGVSISHAAKYLNKYQQWGEYFGELLNNVSSGNTGNVLAVYEDFEITTAVVEYRHKVNAVLYKTNETDLEVVNRIIRGKMILDEAKRLGLSATQEEIDAIIENSRYTYSLPEGKEMMDDYCQGAGITIEEYFDILEDQLPESIARNKLKAEYAKQYCEENGLEYRYGNSTPAIEAAVEAKLTELFDKNKHKIRYFINTQTSLPPV